MTDSTTAVFILKFRWAYPLLLRILKERELIKGCLPSFTSLPEVSPDPFLFPFRSLDLGRYLPS